MGGFRVDLRLPDFIVIGAMKCATTTLHAQLDRLPGIFMSRTKEPSFFSDDAVYARGLDWYGRLFAGARAGMLCGESSTHYTKRPTHPRTVERLHAAAPGVKLIYVMRHPLDRLLSHLRHERNAGRIDAGLSVEDAVDRYPELIDYGRFAMQLDPYFEAFGPDRVLPVFLRRLADYPQSELERIARFLGYPGTPRWDATLGPLNAGERRLRYSPLRHALVTAPLLTPLRQCLLPRSISDSLKCLWLDRSAPPLPPPDLVARLTATFDDDLARLGSWLGVELSCENFRQVTREQTLEWARQAFR
jgi:hypothetical protein